MSSFLYLTTLVTPLLSLSNNSDSEEEEEEVGQYGSLLHTQEDEDEDEDDGLLENNPLPTLTGNQGISDEDLVDFGVGLVDTSSNSNSSPFTPLAPSALDYSQPSKLQKHNHSSKSSTSHKKSKSTSGKKKKKKAQESQIRPQSDQESFQNLQVARELQRKIKQHHLASGKGNTPSSEFDLLTMAKKTPNAKSTQPRVSDDDASPPEGESTEPASKRPRGRNKAGFDPDKVQLSDAQVEELEKLHAKDGKLNAANRLAAVKKLRKYVMKLQIHCGRLKVQSDMYKADLDNLQPLEARNKELELLLNKKKSKAEAAIGRLAKGELEKCKEATKVFLWRKVKFISSEVEQMKAAEMVYDYLGYNKEYASDPSHKSTWLAMY